MNEDKLKEIFGEFLSDGQYIPADALNLLGRLIRLTIEFRDRLKADTGEIVTVDDTIQALDAYKTACKTKNIPDGLNDKSQGLVSFWLENIDKIN